MFLRREHLAALVVAVSLAAVSGPARAQTTQTHFTAQHAIHFSTGTDQDRKVLSAIPSSRDMVAQPFAIAREDLNDDGSKEVILMGTSSDWCGSGGCAIVVLDKRAGKWVPILEYRNVFSPLVVTNEKIGEYRALAAVDDKGVIVSVDRPGTPMSGEQCVYAMKAPETTRERDSVQAADSVAEEQAARPFQAAPVPPGQRRFAKAVNRWCHGMPADTGNLIAREQADREFSRRLRVIVRGVGPIRDWSGIILHIEPGSQFSDASVTVSVDTVSSYTSGLADAEYTAAARVTAAFNSKSPAYAAASRVQVGQRVFFSGRALEAASEQFVTGNAGQGSCHSRFAMELTALRPAP